MARRPWGAGQEFQTARGQHVVRKRAPDGTLVTGTSTRSLALARRKWTANVKALASAPSSTSEPEHVAAYLARWLDERASLGTLGPRTLRTYRMLVRDWISPVVGHIDIADLAPADVKAVIRNALDRGRSPQWAKHTQTVLRSALADALDDELVTRNVAAMVPSPKVPRHEVTRLTTDQMRTFLEHTAEHPMYALWVLALTTGMRQGEILGLYWSDIDWKASTITVARTLHPLPGTLRPGCQRARRTRWEVLEPKTDTSRRTIDLSALALDALRDHRKRLVSALLVFPRRSGNGPLSPEHVSRTWKALLGAAGLPVVPFHASRHTAISEALDISGGDLRAARDMAGHSRLSTTSDLYGGLARRATRRIADGMDERLGRKAK